jgi:hypothetical protein
MTVAIKPGEDRICREKISVIMRERVAGQAWDERSLASAEGSYRQTVMFAEHQAKRCHEKALYFEAFDGDGQVVGQLLTRLGAPFSWGIRRRFMAGVALPVFGAFAPCMYWGDGPVVFTQRDRSDVYAALLQAAVDEASRRGCIAIEAWPAFYGATHGGDYEWIYSLYTERGFHVARNTTLVVDLCKDREELWRGIRKEARTKVRKAQEQGVEIVELGSDEALISLAHGVVAETAVRNEVACWPLVEMLEALRYHSSYGVFKAFLALYQGQPIAYQHVTFFNGNAQLGGVAYSDYSRQARIYGNDLMQWHVLQTMHDMGVRCLDYGGADPNSQDPKIKGIYKFKAKWGGQLLRCDRFRLLIGGGHAFSVRRAVARFYERAGAKTYRAP